MLKKNKTNINYVYSIYDTVAKRYRGTFYHPTDEDMIRTTLPTILMDYPLRDIEIYRIGIFDDISGTIRPCIKHLVSTSQYTFPHSRLSSKGDDLPLEEIDVEMKKQKAEMIDKLQKESLSDDAKKELEKKEA